MDLNTAMFIFLGWLYEQVKNAVLSHRKGLEEK